MLHLHRAERADALVRALADLLAAPLADPIQAEIISVPTRGVERWLSQRLSARLGVTSGRGDGVCANVEFPFPGTVVGGAMATASGVERDADPWQPERAVWPLLEVVNECLAQPWLTDLAAHLGSTGADPGPARRFTSVRRISDLFDRYAVHRPQMVRAWAGGEDIDGAGRPLPDRALWQAELWRRLAERLVVASPAERLDRACERLIAEPEMVDLPPRLSIFGLTRLPASYLQVLTALSSHRDIHLFLLHPSPELWRQIAGVISGGTGVIRRAADRTAELPSNRLLASWGRDARELQLVLTAGGGAHVDHHYLVDVPATTLLQRLQDDVRDDRLPPGPPLPLPGAADLRTPLEESDRSLTAHDCHGRARQVEVVRDVVLHLLADDPSLEARDIVVMCPDIEAYAPLIHATFGAGEMGGDPPGDPAAGADGSADEDAARPPDLRVRLADRSIRQTNPVLGVVSELLSLVDSRLTAPQVLDLAGRDPVRRRFRFDDDDLARLQEWVAAVGVRWGLDGAHRAAFSLDRVEANTWRSGLDRMLLGVAMAEEEQRLFGGVLPLDDVESGAIDLVGRFAEFIDRLQYALDSLAGPKSLPDWLFAVGDAADALTTGPDDDAWQLAQLRRLLDDLSAEAGADRRPELELPEIRSILADRLRGRPTRANFRTGHLTMCTLVPMRSVPHRVVILLGLDDGVFPRQATRDGDDLTLDDPYVGDRDPRSEDRQLLLDALMAATDRLVITYAGRDERTNAERAPAVPVGELLDAVDRSVRTSDDRPAREHIVVRHPLQPYDSRNFTIGALLADRPWSFDAAALNGARSLAGPRADREPFLTGRLPAPAGEVVEVDRLVQFVQHPVKAFLRRRLGVNLGDFYEEVAESLPVALDPLERWGVGQRLLDARLAGATAQACIAAEIARGILPPGAFAQPVLDEVGPTVEALVAAAAGLADAGERTVDVHVPLPDGRTLVGTVPVLGTLLRSVIYSRVGAKHRLAAWVRFLCLTAAEPSAGISAATVGRNRYGARQATVTVAHLAPIAGDAAAVQAQALDQLAELVDLYDRGMAEPLPLYCASSAAYAAARAAGADPDKPARAAWLSSWDFPHEDRDPEHVLVLGEQRPYDDLLLAPPTGDEDGPGWAPDEPSRFGRYARRLWEPLLRCEKLVDR